MRLSSRALVVAAACLAAPLTCLAVDGTVTITGNVTAETCTINSGGAGSSFTVVLPTVSATTLNSGVGNTAGRTRFTIVLTGCTGFSSGSVFPYFEPGATINAAGRLTTTPGASAAANVDVELLNSAFGVVNLANISGSQNVTPVSLAGNAATLVYYAQYRAIGTVTLGTVGTSVTYTIVYP